MPGSPEPDAVQRQDRPVSGRRTHRVEVKPELLQWACNRSGRSTEELTKRQNLKKLDAWLKGKLHPTFRQLEEFARATYTPIGYFFLETPPVEELPVTDFRTVGDLKVRQPSPNLLDTLYLCQRRQDWYRNELRTAGEQPVGFVGSLTTDENVVMAAEHISDTLCFDIERRRQEQTWTGSLRHFIEQIDALGVLVMVSGVVGNNTSRKLDEEEFLGFALSDPMAPLVFINGTCSKSAQIFTLAHEVAHIWLGQSGVSNNKVARRPDDRTERWCDQVAAELLVPSREIQNEFNPTSELNAEIIRLARHFKVSTLVVLRRIRDTGKLDRDDFWSAWRSELVRLRRYQTGKGGNYYLSAGSRTSKRFARTLAVSTLEGRTTFTEALRLMDMKKVSTFMNLAQNLGVIS